jgi:hypothetical protein
MRSVVLTKANINISAIWDVSPVYLSTNYLAVRRGKQIKIDVECNSVLLVSQNVSKPVQCADVYRSARNVYARVS